jgi:hypothetical protein
MEKSLFNRKNHWSVINSFVLLRDALLKEEIDELEIILIV